MELQGLSERLALMKTVKQLGLKYSEAIGLAHKLVYETMRRKNFIDRFANIALAPHSLEHFNLGIRAFLRLYIYQTKFVKVDSKNAMNMASMGRSILGWRDLKDVEEALDKILKIESESILKGLDYEERIGLVTGHPSWFVSYSIQLLGKNDASRFLESSNRLLPTYIRINTLKGTKTSLLRRLMEDGIVSEEVKQLRHTYKIVEITKPLVKTDSFRNGLFYIQDKASSLAVEVADPLPRMTVLDICAAPGGKTTYFAQLMKNEGIIYSIDYSKRRMRIWDIETRRMGLKIAVPIILDAQISYPLKISADLVFLDPPCSGTGVFSRVPSARWRITKDSVKRMSVIQWRMLNESLKYVKEGGHLVYSTCSITLEENEMIVEKLLKRHPELDLVDTTPKLGVSGLRDLTKCQRLYPHMHDCSGFFVAKLVRANS
jgi:16S rRNA (cytosine967-C5)-methyltransferase